jgi:hypothetical protein
MIASTRWDGAPIRAPGIYSDIPLSRYHQGDIAVGPSVSSTTLRRLWNESPAHAWAHDPANPNRIVEDDSEAYVLGRATHHLICGQAGFSDEFIVRPTQAPDGRDWHGSNKSCIKWLAEQKRIGRTVLTMAQVEQIKGMAIALGENALVQEGILNGLIERSLLWQDPETQLWIKVRPDNIPNHSGDYADLKTTESTLYNRVQHSIGSFGYHMQASLVLQAAQALDLPAETFSLVFVEKAKPHCTRVLQLRDEDLKRGALQNRYCLRIYADCIASGNFPGPGDDRDAEYVDLSPTTRTRIDERLKFELREAA